MNYNFEVSIVIPLFNEEESLPELTQWIETVFQKFEKTYELIFVDDGSEDRSWEVIQELAKKNPNIKAVSFNRNYGKSAGLNTGFSLATGKVVITMDADLQDSPEEIPGLYAMIVEEGYHLVSGWKKKRFDPISKTIPTKLFNAVTRYFSGIHLHDFNCGLKAYQHRVVKSIEIYGEMHRYIPVIAKWHGFKKIGEKVVEHRARKYGVTKFGLERFLYGFLDLLSITFVTRFRKRPMHFFGAWGLLSFIIGFSITMRLVVEKFYKSKMGIPVRDVTEQPLFYLALVAVIVGVQLFLAGYISEMMNSYNHKKNEYLLADRVNC
ncbi:MAG: glycosyltransferase family 2 protein [Cytophagales bacterium]